eukprot:363869-Chlamydomonas_euryale.AAC.14
MAATAVLTNQSKTRRPWLSYQRQEQRHPLSSLARLNPHLSLGVWAECMDAPCKTGALTRGRGRTGGKAPVDARVASTMSTPHLCQHATDMPPIYLPA